MNKNQIRISNVTYQRISNRRYEQKRKSGKKLFTAFFCLVVLCLLTIFSSVFFTAKVASAKNTDQSCRYESIMIENGDSLWSIASEHAYVGQDIRSYISEIKKVNSLSDDNIHAGNHLIVPVYD